MLGPPNPRCLDQPIAVSLEELVPADNFYLHLEAKLDLGFIRDWTRELYAERGRPSIDPVVFFKLQLIMFFEGIRSERKLIETASLNFAHRWYLGYALDEQLPDHSSLTRIRQRLGIDIFQRFFEQVVNLCQEAGLVWGRELYFDATWVRADADTDSLVLRFYREAKTHLTGVFATDPAPSEEQQSVVGDSPISDGFMPFPTCEGEHAVTEADVNPPRWNLLDERRLDPMRPSHRGYRRTSDFWVSTTDPDATPMWTAGKARLGYHDHYVVAGSLPAQAPSSSSHRGHHLWHGGEHRRPGGRRHSRPCAAPRHEPPLLQPVMPAHSRRSARKVVAAGSFIARSTRTTWNGSRLSRHRGLQESDAQAPGLGGAVVC
jgi:transposase